MLPITTALLKIKVNSNLHDLFTILQIQVILLVSPENSIKKLKFRRALK